MDGNLRPWCVLWVGSDGPRVDLLRSALVRAGPAWSLELGSAEAAIRADLVVFDLDTQATEPRTMYGGAGLRIAACARGGELARERARELGADGLIEWGELARADVRDLYAEASRARLARLADDRARELSLRGLAAAGRLAQGLEHPFANLLQTILGHLQLASGIDARSDRDLQVSLAAAQRARELVRGLAGLYRSMAEPRCGFAPAHVDVLVLLVRAMLQRRITLDVSGGQLLGVVDLDAAAITWLFVELVEVAQRWLPQGGGIELALDQPAAKETVRLALAARAAQPLASPQGGPDGERDLARLRSLAAEHGASFEVAGATRERLDLCLRLPARLQSEGPRVRGRVLHVESREAVVSEVSSLLSELGFATTRVNGAAEALELLRARREAFDVVLGDESTMDLPARVFAREALVLEPGIPIVLASGFPAPEDPELGRALSFVPKPYAAQTLDAALRAAMQSPLVRGTAFRRSGSDSDLDAKARENPGPPEGGTPNQKSP